MKRSLGEVEQILSEAIFKIIHKGDKIPTIVPHHLDSAVELGFQHLRVPVFKDTARIMEKGRY